MIETDRLILRPHTRDDYDGMCAMFSNPEFFRLSGLKPQTREEVWHRLLRYVGHWTVFGWGLFAITEKRTGRFIGETGFADFHRGLHTRLDVCPEAAWALTPAEHGKGYALEAVMAVHQWFDDTRPQPTVCIITPVNMPSMKIAETMGYKPFSQAIYKGHAVALYERRPGI